MSGTTIGIVSTETGSDVGIPKLQVCDIDGDVVGRISFLSVQWSIAGVACADAG